MCGNESLFGHVSLHALGVTLPVAFRSQAGAAGGFVVQDCGARSLARRAHFKSADGNRPDADVGGEELAGRPAPGGIAPLVVIAQARPAHTFALRLHWNRASGGSAGSVATIFDGKASGFAY